MHGPTCVFWASLTPFSLQAPDSYFCSCALGYESSNCQDNINDCASFPCQNNATCTDSIDLYTCACFGGWEGYDCEVQGNPCILEEDDCNINAHCIHTGPGAHSCQCHVGWEGNGTLCTDVDECQSIPCQNGGTCDDSTNAGSFIEVDVYTCDCVRGFIGRNCQENEMIVQLSAKLQVHPTHS